MPQTHFTMHHTIIAATGLQEVFDPAANFRAQFERIVVTSSSATTIALSYTDSGEQVIITFNIPAAVPIDIKELGLNEPTPDSPININVAAGTVAAIVYYTIRRPKDYRLDMNR